MEKANENGFQKVANLRRELEDLLWAQTLPVIHVGAVSGARKALRIGRIMDAQESIAGAVRLIDEAGEKAKKLSV